MHRNYSFTCLNNPAIAILTGLVLTVCIGQLVKLVVIGSYWYCLFIPLGLMGLHYRLELTRFWRFALMGMFLAIILLSSRIIGSKIFHNVAQPPEWDFLCFWLPGKVAVQGLNFYEPEHARRLAQTIFTPSPDFTRQILDVGFWYPPPSIFLFAPLGWLDVHVAILTWYVFHLAVLAGCVFWIWRIFLKEYGRHGFALSAVLLMIMQGTFLTFEVAQTNFLALLMFLLFWHDRARIRGGIWLTVGIFVKPFLAMLFLYLVLRQNWKVLTSTIASLVIVSLLTVGTFGLATCLSYFNHDNRAELPALVYTEPVNQSLSAFLLRLTHYDFSHTSALSQPLFILLGLILTGITAWLTIRLDPIHDDWALAIILLLSLLVYPASLSHYSVFLIVPLMVIWTRENQLRFRAWKAAAFISLEYIIMSQYDNVFVANSTLWLALVWIGMGLIFSPLVQPTIAQNSD
jgi:Glycosyltransferase family 87